MALELSSLDKMVTELSPGDSRTTSCPNKRPAEDSPRATGVDLPPTKREKVTEDVMPQQGKSNARGQPFAAEDRDLGSNDCEPLRVSYVRNNAGDGTASSSGLPSAADDTVIEKESDPIDSSEKLETMGTVEPVFTQRRRTPRRSGRHVAGATVSEHEPKSVAGSFRLLVRILTSLQGRLELRDKADVEKALLTTCSLELMCAQQSGEMSDTARSLDSEPGENDIDVENSSLFAGAAGEEGREFSDDPCSDSPDVSDSFGSDGPFSDSPDVSDSFDSDGPCSDSPDLGFSGDYPLQLEAPGSVSQRQQSDRELREKIHEVETDYWANRTPRDVYNEERSKLYTEEEMKEACIVWPRLEEQSPAGYREELLERGNYRCFEGGPSWDDDLYQFGCPFKEDNYGGDEEAAKTRLRDKIEGEFEDPEARRAEHNRWEKIREVETKYYRNEISRTEYNQRRLALYTEAEREEKGVVWPRKESEMCYSPAGFREAVFDQYDRTEDGPDWQTRMDFHYPFAVSSTKTTSEENLCELCVPLIETHRNFLVVQNVRRQELEAIQKVAREEEVRRNREEAKLADEKKRKKKAEAKLAKQNGLPCAECNRKFASQHALSQHTADKHQK